MLWKVEVLPELEELALVEVVLAAVLVEEEEWTVFPVVEALLALLPVEVLLVLVMGIFGVWRW